MANWMTIMVLRMVPLIYCKRNMKSSDSKSTVRVRAMAPAKFIKKPKKASAPVDLAAQIV